AGLFYWVNMFRMPLFFLIAGFFAHLSFHRQGLKAFIKDRFKRIVIPLVTAWPMVFTGIIMVVIWIALIKFNGSLPKESPPGPKFTPDDFPLTHLWFLYVLSLLYIAILAIRTLLKKLDHKGYVRAALDAFMRLLMKPGASLLLALPLAAGLYFTPKWVMWFGIPTPDSSLYPNLAACIGFLIAFVLGWGLHRQITLLQVLKKYWWLNLLLAVIATAASLSITGLSSMQLPVTDNGHKLTYAFTYSAGAWSWALALVGMGLRFLSDANPKRRYLADSSYWVYIVHLPIVMALQVAASLVNWPWWVEYPLMLALGFALMLGSYELFVRHTFIGACLNGRKIPRVAKNNKPSSDISALAGE
ncbi:MAG: acyltransferase family protein, partial [Arenimonas sp.]